MSNPRPRPARVAEPPPPVRTNRGRTRQERGSAPPFDSRSDDPACIVIRLVAAISVLIGVAGCSQQPFYAAGLSPPPPGAPLGGAVAPDPAASAAWGATATRPMSTGEARIAELNRRVQLLDDDNRQLHTQLAQSEQRVRVAKDETTLLREQLAGLSDQLESTRLAAASSDARVRGMTAASAATRPPGATLRANTNGDNAASAFRSLGVPVETAADSIRLVIPADRLFNPSTATPHAGAVNTIDPIVAQIRANFADRRIGVEAYTDAATAAASDPHAMTAAQAGAVLNLIATRGGIRPDRLFTVAQGAAHPRADNATPAGRATNRRIELVIYH